jgi:murein DD-endopeptidase MepM/ murein hydrolase activator NlpD
VQVDSGNVFGGAVRDGDSAKPANGKSKHLTAALCGGAFGVALGLAIIALSGHGGASARTIPLPHFSIARVAPGEPAPVIIPNLIDEEEDSPFARLGVVQDGPANLRPHHFSELVPATDGVLPGRGDEPLIYSVALARGDTLMKVLTDAGSTRTEAQNAIDALVKVYDPRRLRSGQEITLTLQPSLASGETKLLGVDITADVGHAVAARRDGAGFRGTEVKVPLQRNAMRGQGVINDSLYLSAVRAGVPVGVVVEMIRMFSWDVDFERDIQPGDKFEVMFERYSAPNGSKDGVVSYASLTLGQKQFKLYRFEFDDGVVDYFNERGFSVRKALLKTPIDGAKLTSKFGMRRHPILGFSMMHRGIDFGAPSGTPIYAAGDGTIELAGWQGAYGNYVRLKHSAGYSTAYGHMSSVAKGMRAGTRVRQGQVIGYVGTTGRSTGPHLHYEVLKGGTQVNPLGIKIPEGRKLEGEDSRRFLRERDQQDLRYAGAQVLPAKVAENR